MSVERTVAAQYEEIGLAQTVLKAAVELAAAKSTAGTGRMTARDLAPFDQLHIGGARATATVLAKLDIRRGMHWLDVGSGLGGASRYAAAIFGCRATGIDVTPDFCAAARRLSELAGIAGATAFVQGSALAMPFADAAFDGAFAFHAGMNIADKPRLYGEIHRVLKPGAVFGIYDILAGASDAPVHFPVPWATTPAANFLVSLEEMRSTLRAAGFKIEKGESKRRFALGFYRRLRQRTETGDADAKGLGLIMGGAYRERIANAARSMIERRCELWEFVCRRR